MTRYLSILLIFVAAATSLQTASGAGPAGASSPDSIRQQLAQRDAELFGALFVECDPERANAIFTGDIEFYDDRSGLTSGDEVRESSRRLAENCPAANGVRRILLQDSVEVHTIEGYGAVQMGRHHFIEQGAATSTVGRFVHTWRRVGEEWKLARIISLHETMDAERAASLRGE